MPGRNGEHVYDVVVAGAGAAGVGVAVTLMHAGIESFAVLERREAQLSGAGVERQTVGANRRQPVLGGQQLAYGIESGVDRLQLCAASAWLLANLAALAPAGAD